MDVKDELIRRDAALYALFHYLPSVSKDEIRLALHKVPTVDAVPLKRGKWIEEPAVTGTTNGVTVIIRQFRCSWCGNLFGRVDDKYCGRCGAKMEGDAIDDEG